jgi:hypothetical protein
LGFRFIRKAISVMINIFWPYSHKNSISDQLWTLQTILYDLNVPHTISDSLDPISKNIFIENVSSGLVDQINNFCEKHKKKIVVVPTEFIEISNKDIREFYLNGCLVKDKDQESSEFLLRVNNLFKIAHNIEAFVSLAGQPSLEEYCRLFGVSLSFNLGLPNRTVEFSVSDEGKYDFYFSGAMTQYRRDQISELQNKFSIRVERFFISETERTKHLGKCNYNLNIPQRPDWKWLSTMRVLFGLRCGKFTVQNSAVPKSVLSSFVIELTNGVALPDLVDQKRIQLKSAFSLLDLDPKWKQEQIEFVRYCEAYSL